MGIIQQQTIKGTFYSYLGVLIGFIIAGLLFPLILSTDEIGLLNLLVSFSVLFAQFASLGFNSVIGRLFPYFRNEKHGHHGFLSVALVVTATGFILTFGLFELLKPLLIENNIEKSALFVNYINYIIPLIFFTLFFNLFDSYNKALYDAVMGIFIKEFVQRILILLSLGLYYFHLIDIHFFIQLYIVSLSLPAVFLLIILIGRGEFKLIMPSDTIFSKQMIKEMGYVCMFGIIAGFSTLAILHIDKILVNKFLGLSSTGIYATNFYFATLIVIPSRTLLKISTTIIAESWKKNDRENIFLIYKKSVINQGIISMLIFIGLWINIHNIYRILPDEFAAGKWVILLVALANVTTMSTGVSGTIIGTSDYYRVLTYFIVIFFILIVSLNFILIPLMGLAGAGLSFLLATFIFNLLRYVFIYRRFGMNPYSGKFLLLIILSVITGFVAKMIPVLDNLVFDIALRSGVAVIIFVPLVYFAKISEDLNKMTSEIISYVRKLF